jgi:hypothetical protein
LKHSKEQALDSHFEFKTHNKSHAEKRFMRNFKDVDDGNVNGHADTVDQAYQQFMDFKAKRQEEKERKQPKRGMGGLLGKASRSGNAGRVLDEYNSRHQAADVLGGNDDGPAHVVLASQGRQSSASSRGDPQLHLQSPELSSGQLGPAISGHAQPMQNRGSIQIEMAGLEHPQPSDRSYPTFQKAKEEEDDQNSIEDIIEPAVGAAGDFSLDQYAQQEHDKRGDQPHPNKASLIYIRDQGDGLSEPPELNDAPSS